MNILDELRSLEFPATSRMHRVIDDAINEIERYRKIEQALVALLHQHDALDEFVYPNEAWLKTLTNALDLVTFVPLEENR